MSLIDDFKKINPQIEQTILQYINGQAPQALLIYGPEGVGKKTLAKYLASVLLCLDVSGKPCGVCRNCVRVDNGTHPNLLRPDKKQDSKSIKIDEIRKLIDALSKNAIENGNRILLMEDADSMTSASQNALLKSLEEPDSYSYFILTASKKSSLLPTVLSRCVKLHFPAWKKEILLEKLLMLRVENAAQIADLSFGSIGNALKMAEEPDIKRLADIVHSITQDRFCLFDIPRISILLSREKEQLDNFLALYEQSINSSFSRNQTKKLEALLTAKRMQQSNVSFQGIIDYLLINTAEET